MCLWFFKWFESSPSIDIIEDARPNSTIRPRIVTPSPLAYPPVSNIWNSRPPAPSPASLSPSIEPRSYISRTAASIPPYSITIPQTNPPKQSIPQQSIPQHIPQQSISQKSIPHQSTSLQSINRQSVPQPSLHQLTPQQSIPQKNQPGTQQSARHHHKQPTQYDNITPSFKHSSPSSPPQDSRFISATQNNISNISNNSNNVTYLTAPPKTVPKAIPPSKPPVSFRVSSSSSSTVTKKPLPIFPYPNRQPKEGEYIKIKVRDIKFTQESISSRFTNGCPVSKLFLFFLYTHFVIILKRIMTC